MKKEKSCRETHNKNSYCIHHTVVEHKIKTKNFLSNNDETQRLMRQQQLLQVFDFWSYKKIFDQKPKNILDIGSNNGTALIERIIKHHYNDFYKVIGVDINHELVEEASRRYSNDSRIMYYTIDIEDVNYYADMKRIMTENDISYFDFINISSVILLLDNPFKLLSTLDKFLNPDNGTILILDIDDGLNIAYPDEQNLFNHAFEICNQCKLTGFRRTGRQLYSLLTNATSCKKITLEKCGLDNTTMSQKEKEYFFDVVFKFIGSAIEKESLVKPNEAEIQRELRWFKNNFNQLRESFLQDNFFFFLGYVIFTASKC